MTVPCSTHFFTVRRYFDGCFERPLVSKGLNFCHETRLILYAIAVNKLEQFSVSHELCGSGLSCHRNADDIALLANAAAQVRWFIFISLRFK